MLTLVSSTTILGCNAVFSGPSIIAVRALNAVFIAAVCAAKEAV